MKEFDGQLKDVVYCIMCVCVCEREYVRRYEKKQTINFMHANRTPATTTNGHNTAVICEPKFMAVAVL